MPRWPLHERELLAEVRRRLQPQLAVAPPYPEVVGDRKILRFIRGFKHNVDQATEAYGKFLRWRKEFTPYPGGRVYDVDEIRHEIVSKNLDHPSKFPRGVRILEMIPHLAITPNARDKNGNLICVDQYKFKPGEVVSEIGLPDYLIFAVYCLEFRSLVVEQLSEKEERAFLDSLSPEQRASAVDPHGAIGGDNQQPHGVILGTLVIRDMAGLTMEHCSEVGRQIIKAVVTVSSDNYPELLRRCLLINVPWIFNALWYFIKGMLHESTIRKIQLCGKDYHPLLLQDLQPEHVPVLVGGPYKGGMSPDDPESVLAWDLAFLVEGRTLDAEERLRGPAGGGGAGGGGGDSGAGGGGGDSGAGGDGSEGGASKGPGHQRRMTAMDRMHAQADAADGHSNASSNGANGSNKNSSASSNSSSSSSSNNNSLSLSLSASSIRSNLDKGASLAAAAARSALWKLEHHYLSRYPLWTAAVALYVCDFCLSGRLASVLPQLVPVLLVWAVLFVL